MAAFIVMAHVLIFSPIAVFAYTSLAQMLLQSSLLLIYTVSYYIS
jgi:hypothetical protein